MSTISLSLNLPQELIPVLEVNDTQLEGRILELILLELVREQRISTGKAAELLGISKWEFLPKLAQNDIPYFTESPEELADQLETVKIIFGEQK